MDDQKRITELMSLANTADEAISKGLELIDKKVGELLTARTADDTLLKQCRDILSELIVDISIAQDGNDVLLIGDDVVREANALLKELRNRG